MLAFGVGHSSHTANSASALLGRHAASLNKPVVQLLLCTTKNATHCSILVDLNLSTKPEI